MEKIYVIRYEDEDSSGDYYSGVVYTGYKTLEKAKEELENCRQSEINDYVENGNDEDNMDIRDIEDGFYIDWYDGYTKYEIEEVEIEG